MALKDKIRTLPDYPKTGIMFRDITTLYQDAEGLAEVVSSTVEAFKDQKIDLVAGIEARGFITGPAIAIGLGVGFVPIRKRGKLPFKTISQSYDLEYGSDIIEMHEDSVQPGQRVLIVDDLIATGGTAGAAVKLIERAGAEVAALSFVIDLPDLGGAKALREGGYPVHHLVEFEGE